MLWGTDGGEAGKTGRYVHLGPLLVLGGGGGGGVIKIMTTGGGETRRKVWDENGNQLTHASAEDRSLMEPGVLEEDHFR